MKTPFEILDIPPDSGDEAVREGYIHQVRRYPPERFPEEFQRVRQAFEKIKTERDRLHLKLFDTALPDVEIFVDEIRAKAKAGRPTERELRIFLAEAVIKTSTGSSNG